MKLILNADDLGYTPRINRAIFDLHQRGRLGSASLLANMPHSQAATDGLSACPNLGIGVHLNLTKGRPLLPPKQIPSLVTAAGEFWPTKQFFARANTRLIKSYEVELELRAQIEYLLEQGIQPTHWDSHSHWHMLPHLQKLATWLAAGYQIPGRRQAAPRRTLLPARLWLAAASRTSCSQTARRVPDYLLSLHLWMGSDGQPIDLFFSQRFHRLFARPEVTLELVTHPGAQHDPDFPPDTLLTHQRQWEYNFLLSSHFDEWLAWMEAEMIDYRALTRPAN